MDCDLVANKGLGTVQKNRIKPIAKDFAEFIQDIELFT
jgi:hypothetical protein